MPNEDEFGTRPRDGASRSQEFWRTHVVANLEDYQRHRIDIRRAKNAAISLLHMADHVWSEYHETCPEKVEGTQSVREYVTHLAENCCPEVVPLRDMVEAHKHMKLVRPAKPKRVMTSAGQSGVRSTGRRRNPFGSPLAMPRPRRELVLMLNDGSRQRVSVVLTSVEDMWRNLMEEHEL